MYAVKSDRNVMARNTLIRVGHLRTGLFDPIFF